MLVRIKVDKWKAAKDAMKVVMDHIGNSKSNNGLPGAVIDNISKINENIFINSTEETVGIANNDIDEKVNVTNLTNDEFDAILTEVAPKENSHNLAMVCCVTSFCACTYPCTISSIPTFFFLFCTL